MSDNSLLQAVLILLVIYIVYISCPKFQMPQRHSSGTADSSAQDRGVSADKQKCGYVEQFSDSPDENAVEDPSSPSGVSYQDYVLSSGLDPSVVDSHRSWVADLAESGIAANGSSKQVVLSSTDFINPTIGLRLLPLDVAVGEGAREVPSEGANLDRIVTSKYKYGFF